jgi:nucleotide-binding universal stress UspA family protein
MKIINAVDGSPHSEFATELLTRIPFPAGSEVTLLSVLEELQVAVFSRHVQQHLDEALHDHRLEECSEAIVQAKERLGSHFETINVEQKTGHTADVIIHEAETEHSDLIVLGARGLNAVERFLLGSTSEKVAKYAPCSVLLSHRSSHGETRPTNDRLRILLTCDSSEASLESVRQLAALPLDGSVEIQLLTVHTTVSAYRQDIIQKMSELWQKEQEEAQACLEKAASELKAAGAEHVEIRLAEADDVSSEIISTAGKWNADIIMVGNTGRHRVDRFLLGSVSKRVTRHAPCSVWISRVKPAAG